MKIMKTVRKHIKRKKINSYNLNEEGNVLFGKLREMRTELAREESVPPYIVFADKTLIDMAAKTPITREEMLTVSGVGEAKFDKYGEKSISVIKEYTGGKHVVTSDILKESIESEADSKTLRKSSEPKADFYLTKEQAQNFTSDEDQTAGGLAARMNELRDDKHVKRITGVTITAIITEKQYAIIERVDGLPKITITPEGEEFGIYKVERISQKGRHYDLLLYRPKAQTEVLKWYIRQ